MEEKYLIKLEYNKIVDRLLDCASFSLSKELALGLQPFGTLRQAVGALAETTEAADILRRYPTFSIGSVKDVRPLLRRAELGGSLGILELVDIGDTCCAARQSHDFFNQLKGDYPIILTTARGIGIFKSIETALEKAITPENTIADTASERLYQLRRKIGIQSTRVKERLESFLHSAHTSKFLQDPIVTIRADRYVVPIKAEYRAQVPGIVHDTSSSGATVFIEPLGVLEANNELAKLRLEEQEEIAAVLRALTMVVLGFSQDLAATVQVLAQLDFMLAKARLAEQMKAEAPKLNDRGNINLKQARHPLIVGNVVPIDLKLQSNLSSMVITGPNTGGKTVTLKTLGLLTLMAQSGLHIPAEYGSDVAFFQQVFADIGDEQSIEQSLSTFSSHMTNIVHILQCADQNSLVLMDELGSGTDPTEGAALAMSILEDLYLREVKVVATTHYSELKSFAYNREGFINASVEFDVNTLSPTYRLLMGVPGKSNAFEIARKLGLADVIISRAAAFMSTDEVQVAELITRLEQDRLAAEQARREAEALQAQMQEARRQLNEQEVALHNREAEILRKANLASLKIVEDAKNRSEQLYQEMKEQIKSTGSIGGKDVHKARNKIRQMEEDLRSNLPQDQYAGVAPAALELGQMVEVPKYKQRAQVLSLPDERGNVLVQIGIMKITLALSDLRPDQVKSEQAGRVGTNFVRMSKALDISTEVDLRGCTVDEAMEKLDKYLDDAFLAGLKQVRIIHGKGTGALRAALTPYLKKHRLVADLRLGESSEGGSGCTVVELKL